MGFRELIVFAVISCVYGQTVYKVCVSSSVNTQTCQALDRDGSSATCERVESRIDCALKLARGTADFGVFSEEELLLLGKQQPNEHRVVAALRDVTKISDPYAFEAVALVRSNHTGGLEGLRGGRYCHPGFDQADLRWSPRVLKGLEYAAALTDRCTGADSAGKTAAQMEIETLALTFSAACRPGAWSSNATVDANLKSRFPTLCSLCQNSTCSQGYPTSSITVAGISNTNRHIQALTCLRESGDVTYVAWQHVREFFNTLYPEEATSYSLLCEDGSLQPLNATVLANSTAPCSFVKQPWKAIVANAARAAEVQTALRAWWPAGSNPSDGSWQAGAFSIIGSTSERVVFQDTLTTPLNYTSTARTIVDLESSTSCLQHRAWCTISADEQTKCLWLRQAAYVLGIQPYITCNLRTSSTVDPAFVCLNDIRTQQVDFLATPASFGYLARQHYKLSPVKTVQNQRSNANSFTRVAAFVRETAVVAQNITRFENLRGTKACFPEFGGISFVAFLRAAQERGVISSSECDYARAVGEFFSETCAPGAMESALALSDTSNFDSTTLCSVCRPVVAVNNQTTTCAFDFTNLYFSNNGSLRCLADNNADVAIIEMQNIDTALNTVNGLVATDLRALCRNNSLAVTTGVTLDDNCLLAYVVNSEVIARRNDPHTNGLNELLETLDSNFGYNIGEGTQLINLEIYSPFDGKSDLLFKDTAIGLSEPTSDSANEPSRNYIELFKHLETCTGAAPHSMAARNIYSLLTLAILTLLSRFVVY